MNFTGVFQYGFCHGCHDVFAIGTEISRSKSEKGIKCYLVALVVEDNIWKPNVLRGHVKFCDSPVFIRIPHKFVVLPFLKLSAVMVTLA